MPCRAHVSWDSLLVTLAKSGFPISIASMAFGRSRTPARTAGLSQTAYYRDPAKAPPPTGHTSREQPRGAGHWKICGIKHIMQARHRASWQPGSVALLETCGILTTRIRKHRMYLLERSSNAEGKVHDAGLWSAGSTGSGRRWVPSHVSRTQPVSSHGSHVEPSPSRLSRLSRRRPVWYDVPSRLFSEHLGLSGMLQF